MFTENGTKKSSVCLIASVAVLLLAAYLGLDGHGKEVVRVLALVALIIGGLLFVLAAGCATIVIALRAAVWACGRPLSPLTLRVMAEQTVVVFLSLAGTWAAILLVLQQHGIIPMDPGQTELPTMSTIAAGVGAVMLGVCISKRTFFQWISPGVLPERWRIGIHALVSSTFAFAGAMFAIMWISGALHS